MYTSDINMPLPPATLLFVIILSAASFTAREVIASGYAADKVIVQININTPGASGVHGNGNDTPGASGVYGNNITTSLETIKSLLTPLSLRNALFDGDTCIFNPELKEYIYSPATGFEYDSNKRRVFSWLPGAWDHKKLGDWRFVVAGDRFYIATTNNKEYLFADTDEHVTAKMRRVFTARLDNLGDTKIEQGLWELESIGNDVYIKNAFYNERLFALFMYYDRERRSLATWTDKRGCETLKLCIWRIGLC